MNMSWFEGLFYGLVSGIAEFLPISSQAHQRLLMLLCGVDHRDPLRDLIVNLMLLISVYTVCKPLIEQRRQISAGRHIRGSSSGLEQRLLKNAAIPLLIGILLLRYILPVNENLFTTAIFLLINGVILYIPERMIHANKDARSMSLFDSLLIGTAGALSAFTGISRLGAMSAAATARGSARDKALNWALILCMPALILLAGINMISIFSAEGRMHITGSFFSYVFSAAGAYLGGYFGITLIKSVSNRTSMAFFAYYSWGAALLSFLLYLIVV